MYALLVFFTNFIIVDKNTSDGVIPDDSDEKHSIQHQIINHFPSKNIFQREKLSMYNPEIIIGNLKNVVKSIEELVGKRKLPIHLCTKST